MIKKILNNFVLFVFSKGAVIFSPLFAASVLSNEDYGLFEWSISVSLILSTLFSLASGNTIAFEKIRDDNSPLIVIGKQHSMLMFIFLLFLSALSIIFSFSKHVIITLGITSILVIKEPLASFIKAAGLGARATVVDSILYIICLFILLVMYFFGQDRINSFFVLPFFGIMIAILLRYTIRGSLRELSISNYLKFAFRGIPIMFSGILGIIFFSVPRLVLEKYSLYEVGNFSIYLRWASIALIGYQFVYVLLFRNIFKKKLAEFENLAIKILSIVCCIGLILIPIINSSIFSYITILKLPNPNILLQTLMSIIIVIWVCSGLLEGVLYRENKSLYNIASNSVGLSVFFSAFLMINTDLANIVERTAISWSYGFLAIIILQTLSIENLVLKNGKMIKMRLFLMLSFFALTFLSFSILN